VASGDGAFGGLLRSHRLQANLTHEALAARSGLSVDTISMLERGVHLTPRRSTLVALVRGLRLPPGARDAFFAAAEPPAAGQTRTDPGPAPPLCPSAIAEDRSEAYAALAAGLPRAAAAMALRAIQGVCVDRGATAGASLRDRIEELGRVQVLHPALLDWARQIRLLTGATTEAGANDVDRVTPQDVLAAVAFLDELLGFTYEVPDRLGRRMSGAAAPP
jgi:transcriptional regulator with XRE-family HTH domain